MSRGLGDVYKRQLLHHIATAQNKAILLSTHDIEQALVLADCLWLLRKGHGMRSGITEDLILNGELDTLFDRKEICFDRAHGSYYPSVQWEKEIVVDATDETLLHWTVNALNRNNYGCRISPCEADASLPRLTVERNDSLSLHTATNEVRFTSFAAFIAYLKTPTQKG